MHREDVGPDDNLPPQQGNEKVLVGQIRSQFKANIKEVDDDKVSRWGP